VGYTYSLGNYIGATSGTQPLTQTNVPGYAYNTTTQQGGLSVPAPNVWKVATKPDGTTAFNARRAIVETARCNACHGALGVAPTFHAGQRNDGATCSFCHTPNRTSNGWSAGSKYFIHAIHATRIRTTPFGWHQVKGEAYDAEFPSPLNDCESCHAPKTYDFSLTVGTATPNLDSISSQLLTTVGQDSVPQGATVAVTYAGQADQTLNFAPWVDSTTVAVPLYGLGFSYSASTGATVTADPTTLVISQITTACASCHDSQSAMAHMKINGGHFYDTRANTLASFGESCLTCHGPGKDVAIGTVHK